MQQGQIGVGFHGVVDAGASPLKAELVAFQGLKHRVFGVGKQGGTKRLGQIEQAHAFQVQLAIRIVKLRRTRQARFFCDEGLGHDGLGGAWVHGAGRVDPLEEGLEEGVEEVLGPVDALPKGLNVRLWV